MLDRAAAFGRGPGVATINARLRDPALTGLIEDQRPLDLAWRPSERLVDGSHVAASPGSQSGHHPLECTTSGSGRGGRARRRFPEPPSGKGMASRDSRVAQSPGHAVLDCRSSRSVVEPHWVSCAPGGARGGLGDLSLKRPIDGTAPRRTECLIWCLLRTDLFAWRGVIPAPPRRGASCDPPPTGAGRLILTTTH
jgi:hypothetical protein